MVTRALPRASRLRSESHQLEWPPRYRDVGQADGYVNRLMLIKRAMYARATLDLLRIRVLARLWRRV